MNNDNHSLIGFIMVSNPTLVTFGQIEIEFAHLFLESSYLLRCNGKIGSGYIVVTHLAGRVEPAIKIVSVIVGVKVSVGTRVFKGVIVGGGDVGVIVAVGVLV